MKRILAAALLLTTAAVAAELPVGRWLPVSWADISPEARIFLVAGSRDSANFAQEVVDQKKFWLAQGYSASQIECFYVSPPPLQRTDSEQFLALAEDLQSCHLASPQVVLAALGKVAQNYRQEFFYLYVTSHGSEPLLQHQFSAGERRQPGMQLFVEAQEQARADPESSVHGWFAPYRIEMEGTGSPRQWGWLSFADRLQQAVYSNDDAAEGQLFTPKFLAEALQKFPASVKKLVVLQACHSGGFLLPAGEAPDQGETLVKVQNVTVLTAARSDRTSFGCDPGGITTYYGGALQAVLEDTHGNIAARDWQQVHGRVAEKVRALEAEQGIASDMQSLPQYFSNIARN